MFTFHTLNFETVEGAVPPGGEATPPEDGQPAAEGGELGWAGPSEEEWTQTQTALQQISEYVSSQQQPADGETQIPDPYTEPEQFQAWLDQRVDERNAPYRDYMERATYSEADQRALDILADNEAQHGEFLGKAGEGEKLDADSREVAYALAESFLGEAQQRHGAGPKAAEAALARAADVVRQLEERIGKAYHDRQQNQLGTLASAPRQPGAGAQGAQQVVIREGGNELDLVRDRFGT